MTLVILLFLYVGLVFAFPDLPYRSDAGRYMYFATNLSQGYFSPRDMPNLANGPGYPLILAPLAALQLPLLIGKLFNAVFLFLAVLYFHATLSMYVGARSAVWASLLFGLYPPILLYVPLLATESLTFFLICGFMYHFCRMHRESQRATAQSFLAAAYLGYLALTKVFFGYVITVGLIVTLGVYLWTRGDALKKTVTVCSWALVFCLPYLFYTYSLTGRVFYWASAGGEALYWASSPYDGEYGDYIGPVKLAHAPQAVKNHGEFFQSLEGLSPVDQDVKFRERALSNIRRYPMTYLKNRLLNIGRMLFSYPYSYTPQKPSTFFYLLSNLFYVIPSLLCLYPVWAQRRQVPQEIYFLVVFFLIAFGGSALPPAEPRQLAVLVPISMLWTTFAISHLIRTQLRR